MSGRGVLELTEKQTETVEMLASGYTSKHIAARSGISPQGVDRRIQGLLRKTGCSDRGELVRWHLQQSGLSAAPKSNLGTHPDSDPSSETERITADMDGSARLPPQLPHESTVTPYPETHLNRARVLKRLEWLGAEVTWLQVILALIVLREAYEIFG